VDWEHPDEFVSLYCITPIKFIPDQMTSPPGVSTVQGHPILVDTWRFFPSKDEHKVFDAVGYSQGLLLPHFLFKPIVEGQVFVNQEASHMSFWKMP